MNDILIADSGSTKTDWCIIRGNCSQQRIRTSGINPFLQTENEIRRLITDELVSQIDVNGFSSIFFYGAGCTFFEKSKIVESALKEHFNAEVFVASDLLAAAHALCGHKEGIACILGTGSNSCQYDGKEIVKHVPPLGYILGDEGSATTLGRLLAAELLKGRLSKEMEHAFYEEMQMSSEVIMDNVYRQPFPNRFMAELQFFLERHIEVEEIRKIVENSFQSFFRRNVMQYDYQHLQVGFVGSIAYYYRDVLASVAKKENIQIGTILKSPLEGLIAYHSKES